jgi:hypothetical protein
MVLAGRSRESGRKDVVGPKNVRSIVGGARSNRGSNSCVAKN